MAKKTFVISNNTAILDMLLAVRETKEKLFIVSEINNIKKLFEAFIQPIKKDPILNQISNIVFTSKEISRKNINDIDKEDKQIFIYIPDKKILFHSTSLSITYKSNIMSFVLEIPISIHLLDKRASNRLSTNEDPSHNITIKFKKKFEKMKRMHFRQFQFSYHDISTGGISFIIEQDYIHMFNVNDIIDNIVISINHEKELITQAKIANIQKIKPSKINKLLYINYRVGLSFINLSINNQTWLDTFITSFKALRLVK
ncbi:MAG: PilZ domain-containing protein [Oligoflexia bacterium]|nr:PilZ domain-containing protein [Oligoflexia bacterium]